MFQTFGGRSQGAFELLKHLTNRLPESYAYIIATYKRCLSPACSREVATDPALVKA